MRGSIPLMTMSMTVKTVLHSTEVVHIPHESWPSWIAGYSLYRWAPLHTSGVCAWTLVQGCSMVFPSLQCTCWGFTEGVGSNQTTQAPLLHLMVLATTNPHIFNQMDPKSLAQSAPSVGMARLVSTTYYARPYPYRLMVVLFSWVAAPWTSP
jgi:hypothetical protein